MKPKSYGIQSVTVLQDNPVISIVVTANGRKYLMRNGSFPTRVLRHPLEHTLWVWHEGGKRSWEICNITMKIHSPDNRNYEHQVSYGDKVLCVKEFKSEQHMHSILMELIL